MTDSESKEKEILDAAWRDYVKAVDAADQAHDKALADARKTYKKALGVE